MSASTYIGLADVVRLMGGYPVDSERVAAVLEAADRQLPGGRDYSGALTHQQIDALVAAVTGRRGGKSTSPAKAAAARESGKKGGRPQAQRLSTALLYSLWDAHKKVDLLVRDTSLSSRPVRNVVMTASHRHDCWVWRTRYDSRGEAHLVERLDLRDPRADQSLQKYAVVGKLSAQR